jgi:hypothetical protein
LELWKYFDGVPSKETSENVYDYLDKMRGVDAFMKGIPGASVRGLIVGLEEAGVDEYNKVGITKTLLDSKSLLLTANTSTIYVTPYINVGKNGPIVMETPPGMLGAFNDAWFRYIADIGPFGEDKGKGGKYLILPPGMRAKFQKVILSSSRQPTEYLFLLEHPLQMA